MAPKLTASRELISEKRCPFARLQRLLFSFVTSRVRVRVLETSYPEDERITAVSHTPDEGTRVFSFSDDLIVMTGTQEWAMFNT